MLTDSLHLLLGLATLLPLVSFFVILAFGPRLKSAGHGGYVATGAIVLAAVLSFVSFFIWIAHNPPPEVSHHEGHDGAGHSGAEHAETEHAETGHAETGHAETGHAEAEGGHADESNEEAGAESDTAAGGTAHGKPKKAYTGVYYVLGRFGEYELTISYYIDALTICMFCMVTLIASCIHFYAMGYMHDELHDVTDHEVTLEDGSHLTRPGRYHRFFQSLSLFCFSMLGLVLAGNVAMVFVFWELVGICSYFLIGFYVERKSASNAANKAFIVNRVGDFGMIIGLMALWGSLGTFAFGDHDVRDDEGKVVGQELGLFSLIRGGDRAEAPDGMVIASASGQVGEIVREFGPAATDEEIRAEVTAHVPQWREQGFGYGLLVVAGLGIFCGCVGKSAQFPLHVWLPDAMEGPTPVSALVHSATMVAAGVYLVARFYPVFAPEVLLVIAVVGCITLFMAATIAITATDIKRVLAYSTVSQLGYMMLALGVGGWVAGVMHLITHAFFKSLLFMCSGSVIHAVHTNEMTEMGGLRKKMPVTAYTMLIGCLAIAGASIPFVIGFSGYYSKDKILEQTCSFMFHNNSIWGTLFFGAATGGAAITAFYMFRLWFLTFAGEPRDRHRYDHAHESPRVMYVPLIILAFFATTVAWSPFGAPFEPPQGMKQHFAEQDWFPFWNLTLNGLLEQARPDHTLADVSGRWTGLVWPDEHSAHDYVVGVTWLAFLTALGGLALSAAMYGVGYLDPGEAKRQFRVVHSFLVNKWYFDELYHYLFFKPTHVVSRWVSTLDKTILDGIADGSAVVTRWFARTWESLADQGVVDGCLNGLARWTYAVGLSLRTIQTGRLRQYVVFIVLGAIGLFLVISFLWTPGPAG